MIQRETIRNIDDRMVIRQVEKICRSEEFRSKELLCRFLSYIVSEYLAGRAKNLKGYSIGVEVFNRGDDFDPGQDALVRIHAGRLRRMLDLYYLKEGKDDDIRIEIPKGAYTPDFFYPSNMKSPEKARDITQMETRRISKPEVAILPFRNLTGDPGKDYLSQGFSEELSVELTRYEDLTVFNSMQMLITSSELAEAKEIISKKGVNFVIEGAINISGRDIKILVRLTNVQEEKQIWADSFSERLTASNLIEIQGKIAKKISERLGSEYGIILQKLSIESKRIKPQKLDTYNAILKFYYFEAHQTPDAALSAFESLKDALQKDPDSGLANALLSVMHGNRYMLDLPNAEDSFKLAGQLAEKAARLDQHSISVKIALLFKYFVYNEKESFFKIAEECLAMNIANSFRLGSLAFHLSLYGGWERGYGILSRLMETSIGYPLYLHGGTSLYFYRKKDYHTALIEARKYKVPALFWGPMLRVAVLGQLGIIPEVQSEIEDLKKLKPDFEEKAHYLISRFVKEEKLVEHVMEGLIKAGMAL